MPVGEEQSTVTCINELALSPCVLHIFVLGILVEGVLVEGVLCISPEGIIASEQEVRARLRSIPSRKGYVTPFILNKCCIEESLVSNIITFSFSFLKMNTISSLFLWLSSKLALSILSGITFYCQIT